MGDIEVNCVEAKMADLDTRFTKYYIKTHQKMFNYSQSRIYSKEDAEEITNEAFFRFWKVWDKFSEKSDPERKKWMYTAIDKITSEYRRKNKVKTVDVEDLDMLTSEIDDSINTTIDKLITDGYTERIHQILSEKEWLLFDLVFIQDRSYPEVAGYCQIREDTLRARIMRLRQKLEKYKDKVFK